MMREIRFLTATDATTYWDIHLQPSDSEPDAFGSSPEEHRALTLDQIAVRLTSDPANNFVVDASIGERLISTAGFFRNNGHKQRHKGQIWGVYVAQEAPDKGVGRKILRMLPQRAARIEGVEQIRFAVATNQEAAVGWYRSLGFESFGCEQQALKIGGARGNKKAPRTNQSKTPRQPSPRTAKPLMDSRFAAFFCKRHLGNRCFCIIVQSIMSFLSSKQTAVTLQMPEIEGS
jgi:ribosomal protein S18 acetylase RimI-like enzyme